MANQAIHVTRHQLVEKRQSPDIDSLERNYEQPGAEGKENECPTEKSNTASVPTSAYTTHLDPTDEHQPQTAETSSQPANDAGPQNDS